MVNWCEQRHGSNASSRNIFRTIFINHHSKREISTMAIIWWRAIELMEGKSVCWQLDFPFLWELHSHIGVNVQESRPGQAAAHNSHWRVTAWVLKQAWLIRTPLSLWWDLGERGSQYFCVWEYTMQWEGAGKWPSVVNWRVPVNSSAKKKKRITQIYLEKPRGGRL